VIEQDHVDAGRTPMVSWNGTSAATILDGDHDDLIRERARALEDLGVPVLLRFWWEMDTALKKAWAKDPDDFIAAWRHVHRLFDQEGAANVSWVWCPTSLAFTKEIADKWWPGDGWVDWVCADGYNFAPAKPDAPWRSFAEIFDPFYEWALEKGKPIMIGEFGVLERRPGEKATWLRQAGQDLRDRFPAIRAVVYFDTRRMVDGTARDWRIDTSPEAAEAFTDLADSLAQRVRRR
jgi:beta-mannanase